jgi:hypothetical protein
MLRGIYTYRAMYGEVNVSIEKCDVMKGDFIDSWTEHLCSIITKQPTNAPRK